MKKLIMLMTVLFFVFSISTTPADAVLVDNGDGTITDTVTNLMWLKDTSIGATNLTQAWVNSMIGTVVNKGTGEIVPVPGGLEEYMISAADFQETNGVFTGLMSWYGAQLWARSLIFAGYSDWRMPIGFSIGWPGQGATGEIMDLAYTEDIWPSLAPGGTPDPFINVTGYGYWTGTSGVDVDDAIVNTAAGPLSQAYLGRKLSVVGPDQWVPTQLGVWAVRDVNGTQPSCTDNDGDGYGNPGFQLCDNGAATDCNDADINIHPGTIWYEDLDGDGYGNPATSLEQCAQPAGYVLDNTDCNDTDLNVFPAVWYEDSDGDGYGNSIVSQQNCGKPAGYVLDSSDCNDNDANLNPASLWYLDADLDSYGDPAVSLQQCVQPAGYVFNSDDCDDADPGKTIASVWHPDTDGDGFGNPSTSAQMCIPPEGYVLDNTDCNDNDVMINPATPPVRLSGVEPAYYNLLTEAIASTKIGDVIQVRANTFIEDLLIDNAESGPITIEGGYDCAYSAATGITTINGNLTINNGSLTRQSGTIELL